MTYLNEIENNSFCEACFDCNSIKELQDALNNIVDKASIIEWNISELEYFDSIKLALNAKIEESKEGL